jgi:hypothetical protein
MKATRTFGTGIRGALKSTSVLRNGEFLAPSCICRADVRDDKGLGANVGDANSQRELDDASLKG